MSPGELWLPHFRDAEPRILRWLGRRGHDEGRARDVWHGAIVQVLASGVQPDAALAPRSYLWTAVRHEAGRALALRPNAQPLVDEAFQVPSPQPDPSERTMARETRSYVRDAVEGLPEHFRGVLESRFLEGRSALETARALAIPANTVASRTHRGLSLLGARLDRYRHALLVLLIGTLGVLSAVDPTLERTTHTRHVPPNGADVRAAKSEATTRRAPRGFPYSDGFLWVHQPHPEV